MEIVMTNLLKRAAVVAATAASGLLVLGGTASAAYTPLGTYDTMRECTDAGIVWSDAAGDRSFTCQQQTNPGPVILYGDDGTTDRPLP